MAGRAAVLAAAALAGSPAPAELAPADPAIGRLNRAGYDVRHHCTASLVGPREAVTARHCVEGTPPDQLRLVLGYDRGGYEELHRVARFVVSERADIARLCLVEPSAAEPLPASAEAPAGGEAGVRGYPRTRAHAQDRRDCALEPQPDGLHAVLDCPLESGFSGAPVRGPGPDGPVVGVASASNATMSVATLLAALPQSVCGP